MPVQAGVKRSLGASGACTGRATQHRGPDSGLQKRRTTGKSDNSVFAPCNPAIGETEVVQISGIFARPGIANHPIVVGHSSPAGGSLAWRITHIQRVVRSI